MKPVLCPSTEESHVPFSPTTSQQEVHVCARKPQIFQRLDSTSQLPLSLVQFPAMVRGGRHEDSHSMTSPIICPCFHSSFFVLPIIKTCKSSSSWGTVYQRVIELEVNEDETLSTATPTVSRGEIQRHSHLTTCDDVLWFSFRKTKFKVNFSLPK